MLIIKAIKTESNFVLEMKTKLIRFAKWFFGIIFTLIFLISGIIYLFKDRICGLVVTEVNQYLTVPVAASSVDLTFCRNTRSYQVTSRHPHPHGWP